VALSGNPAGATLGGTLTAKPVKGVAIFSDLTLDKIGRGYTLRASSPGVNRHDLVPLRDNRAAGGDHTADEHAPAGSPFGLVVSVEDGTGKVDTTFNGPVTVADFDGNPLRGRTTVTAVHGVATFSGLRWTGRVSTSCP